MSDLDQLADRLKKVVHFQALSEMEIIQIIQAGEIRKFNKGSVIFLEGEASAGLFVLLEGQVQLAKLSPNGQVSLMAVFEPVVMFNEVSALDGGCNPATALAAQDSLIWNTSPKRFQTLLLKHPQLGLGLLRVLAKRNRALVGQFEDLALRSVLGRTAKLLLEISRDGSQPVLRRKSPNHQLAARIATAPEAFSRALNVLRKAGAISCSHDLILVLDSQKLLRAAQIGPAETCTEPADDKNQ